jgi:hypothetical protein
MPGRYDNLFRTFIVVLIALEHPFAPSLKRRAGSQRCEKDSSKNIFFGATSERAKQLM